MPLIDDAIPAPPLPPGSEVAPPFNPIVPAPPPPAQPTILPVTVEIEPPAFPCPDIPP